MVGGSKALAIATALLASVAAVGCLPVVVPGGAGVASPNAQPSSSSPAHDAPLPPSVAAVIEARIQAGHYPGVTVGVIDANGPRYYSFGRRDLRDPRLPDENTVYEIGSINKVFTGLLLADAVQRGEASLEAPIDRYLPTGAQAPRYRGDRITLVQLSTHTSELPRMPDNMHRKDPRNPYADYSLDLLLEFLSRYELPRPPGATYEYSNLGAGLLGYFLASSRGQTFEQMFVERIANVLGLDSTRVVLTPSLTARLVKGTSDGAEAPAWDTPTLSGAGGLRSTVKDLTRFLGANLGLLDTPLDAAMALTRQPHAEAAPGNISVGLGWHIVKLGHGELLMHDGGTGGYRAFIGLRHTPPLGIVVLANSTFDVADIGMHLLDPSLPLTVDGSQPPEQPPPVHAELRPDGAEPPRVQNLIGNVQATRFRAHRGEGGARRADEGGSVHEALQTARSGEASESRGGRRAGSAHAGSTDPGDDLRLPKLGRLRLAR